MTLSPISGPIRESKWIDIDPQPFDHSCFEVSKAMIRLLRHDSSIPREDDGAVRFDDIVEEFKAKFDGTSQWPIDAWITFLAKGRRTKEKVSILV